MTYDGEVMQELYDVLRPFIGPDVPVSPLTTQQMAMRALLGYLAGLTIIRLGRRRLLGRTSAFDIVLGVMLASILGRVVNGGAPLFESLVAAGLLVALHWILGWFSFRWEWIDRLVKGRDRQLVEEGRSLERNLAKSEISQADLLEAVRLQANAASVEKVQAAWLERNGEISVVLRRQGDE